MVFDPSMFKSPVTPEEWRSKMVDTTSYLGDPKIMNTDSKPFFTEPRGYTEEDPNYLETKARFEKHKEKRDELRATGGKTN